MMKSINLAVVTVVLINLLAGPLLANEPYCPSCKKSVPMGSNFCPYCGQQEQSRVAPSTRTFPITLRTNDDAESLKTIITDSTVYYAFTSDHEDPTPRRGYRDFEYESIYVSPTVPSIKPETPIRGGEPIYESRRIAKLGKRRSPVWTKKGDRVAYLDFSAGWKEGCIVLYEVATGQSMFLEGTHPSSNGLSWDETGNQLAYANYDEQLCICNLKERSETRYGKLGSEGVLLSPSGKKVCFMTRDLEDRNDADGWRINILSLDNGDLKKVGSVNDRFGVTTDFFWSLDSTFVVFRGFTLDRRNKRSYGFYSYNTKSDKVKRYPRGFRDVYDQTLRYWVRR